LADEKKENTFGMRETYIPPTDSVKRDQGYVGSFRTYFKYNHKFSNLVNLDVWDVPIAHVYNRPGVIASGSASANPFFENMFILTTYINLTQKLQIQLPIIWEYTRYASFANASNSGRWLSTFWIWPEVVYNVTPSTQVGIAYYSDNLLKDDLSATTWSNGFSKGIFQALLNVTM
jgi:hypothetical protein